MLIIYRLRSVEAILCEKSVLSEHQFETLSKLCAGTNTLGRFINHNMLHSSTEEAHRLSCNNYGSGEVIEERHQFLHVELEAFWLDQVELMASFYAEFFTEDFYY